ncbi:atrial natriuretic peptide receptor 1-like [Paramacrobiotus metropolitanus]|uniref:atrial natriuretic peptide receptor 1-like n=1 Tax=Paramacrobiotus metropolitanus TaxID=2943436 RepID=UPI002445DC5F|nr:atrial natriuretic peptide receptor 1-like [Paramacrobiotus metropolitanus]
MICDDLIANVDLVAKYIFNKNGSAEALAIFPNGCEEGIEIGRLGREWNVPVLPVAVSYTTQKQVQFFPTLVSFAPVNITALYQAHMDLFQLFSWTNIVVIYDSFVKNVFYSQVGEYMRQAALLYPNMKMYYYSFDTSKNYSFTDTLAQIKLQTRVVVLGFHASVIRTFMIAAHHLNMTNEYVYVTTIPFDNKPRYGILKAREERNNISNEEAVAYRSLFQISTSCTRRNQQSALQSLQRKIKLHGIRKYNALYEAEAEDDQPSAIAMAGYFGTKAYGQVLYETILNGEDPSDGAALRSRFLNRTFTFSGQNIHIDETGTRLTDICIKDYVAELNDFEPAIFYDSDLAGASSALSFIKTIDWGTSDNNPPLNEPPCGYAAKSNNDFSCRREGSQTIAIPSTIVPVVVILAVLLWQIRRYNAAGDDEWWKIHPVELRTSSDETELNDGATRIAVSQKPRSHAILWYKDLPVHVKKIKISSKMYPSTAEAIALKKMKTLAYDNLVRMLGISLNQSELTIVHEYFPKGNVAQILKTVHLDWTFRTSFISDLLKGLKVIHSSSLFHHHGHISLSCCLMTPVFTLKLTDFELHKIVIYPELVQKESVTSISDPDAGFIAPELAEYVKLYPYHLWMLGKYADPSADIYSVGCFMEYLLEDAHAEDNIHINENAVKGLANLCKRSPPHERPQINAVQKEFQSITNSKNDLIMDYLLRRMEIYANKLETIVHERTVALQKEKELCHQLLLQMLPRSIVNQLIAGHQVQPQIYYGVTICFSSLVGFVELLAVQTPFFVVQLLNTVFSTFDSCLSGFDAYKVETISDSYMVASGLPEPNGNQHATEICSYAVLLMRTFYSRVSNGQDIHMKIGIHSGACAAGVVGSKCPRYCLFGDTVNLASRLASHGLPSRIHLSSETKNYTELSGRKSGLKFVLRGETELKGAGRKLTYWLLHSPGDLTSLEFLPAVE